MTRSFLATGSVVLPVALALVLSHDAAAQQVGDFDPLGIRAGSFLIHPQVETDASYDDNIFATNNDETDDIIFGIRPSITAESQWSRHQLDVSLDGDAGLYSDNHDSNFYDAGIGLNGRIDVMRNSAFKVRLFGRRAHEERDDPNESGDKEVTKYYRTGMDLGYRHNFNRVYIEPTFTFNRVDFEDTRNVNNDDRDSNRYRMRGRVGYAISPRLSVFGEGYMGYVEYDETPNDSGLDRNSENYGGNVGVEVELTGLLTGEASIGYTKQTYDDDDLDNIDSPAANVSLTWLPTQLTTVVGTLSGEIRETTEVVDGDPASGIAEAIAQIDVTHELRRNIILTGNIGYIHDDFKGTSRTDKSVKAGAGVRYLLNRNLGVDATYDFSHRNSDSSNNEYTRSIFRIGLVAQF
ncbi:MAG: outer membrane beta-barrel protein [Geminicoccaceae bacterium]|nr:outer membrane beta-barrel protein [Geminicoccaceae bacterium]MCB9942637.1 outer membrane beta-barrel protein [Geminicoccaceae bacterium]